jgi:twinkle protein
VAPYTDESSTIIQSNLPCDRCGSRDNAKAYSDGHTYCFGCGAHTQGDGTARPHQQEKQRMDLIPAGEPQGLLKRKLSQETCAHYGYTVSDFRGTPCQVAPYVDREGSIVAQKIRLPNKQFLWVGADQKTVMPFGYQAHARGGKSVVLTEGEVDALSMSQVQGNKWPVWSIPTGAGPQLRKWLAGVKDAGVFDAFDKVVLMFDMDPKGREAVAMAAEIIGPKCVVAELSLKDANEMLVAGRVKEMIGAMWDARRYCPAGIVDMASIRDKVMQSPSWGPSYPWKGLDKITYGRHGGEIITLVAGTGVGKTDVLAQVAEHAVSHHGESIGVFALESSPEGFAKSLCGKHAKRRFNVPPDVGGWTQEELEQSFDQLVGKGKVFLYDSFGANDWTPIKAKMEYLVHAEGVKMFVLDHLTALVAGEEDARVALDRMMEDMASFVVQHGITIYLVSHLNRPKGESHEEGGRVTLAHLRNSGSIAMWSWIVLALERNQQAENEAERFTTTVRCLKNRRDGSQVGQMFYIRYDIRTGVLNEVSDPEAPMAGAAPFKDETNNEPSEDF